MKKYEEKIEQLMQTGSKLLEKVSNFDEKISQKDIDRTKASAMVMKQMINTLDVHIRLEKLENDVKETKVNNA